jgi:aminoglycoside 6'-N-acetyltransferase
VNLPSGGQQELPAGGHRRHELLLVAMARSVSTPELRGRLVRLRPITAADRRRIVEIRGTAEVAKRWRGDDLDAEFADDLADDELHQFAVETDGQVAGLIQFSEEQDPEYRHASIDIFIDPSMHRRGIATDAIGTLVDYLFDQRGHHRLVIDPAVDNMAAIACYRKLGFSPVGVMRAYERQADGSWADGLLMEMLHTDRARVRRR